MDESWEHASSNGDITELYKIIGSNQDVWRRFDEVEFMETPLHLAAQAGCIDFAVELMNLKPSFARKLNCQGLSPLHLAVENWQIELIEALIEIDKDLVRVKGKSGETPLHFLIAKEHDQQLDLLAKILEACPECIRDVTAKNETVLHIASRCNNLKALEFLCIKPKPFELSNEKVYCDEFVNERDINGNTALHIAASMNNLQMVRKLLKNKADKDVTNYNNKTALELLPRGGSEIDESTRFSEVYKLKERVLKYVKDASLTFFGDMDSLSGDDRNASLVILGLLLTATYAASLTPPGALWQGSGDSNTGSPYFDAVSLSHVGAPISSSEAPFSPTVLTSVTYQPTVGTSILTPSSFLFYYLTNLMVFMASFFLTLGLIRPFPVLLKTALEILLALFAICFQMSIKIIAPPSYFFTSSLGVYTVLNVFSLLVVLFMLIMHVTNRVSVVSIILLISWFILATINKL